jgi:hypothetical protein
MPQRSTAIRLAIGALLLVSACAQAPVEPAGSAPAVATAAPPGEAVTSLESGAPVDPALDPNQAAAAVLNASSDAGRRDAILGILAAAGIGVYTADGQPVVVGAERSSDDFFAYDFEVAALGIAVRDGDTTMFADMVDDLAAAGISDGETAITVEDLASAIQRAAAAASDDSSMAGGYGIRVVRALTQQGPTGIDLAEPFDAAEVRLDSLSVFLLAADITLPSLDAAAASPGRLVAQAASADRPPRAVLAASAACDNIGRLADRANRTIGQIAQELLRNGLTAQQTGISPYLHAVLMHAAVEAKMTGSQGWHYFHRDTGNTGIAAYSFTLRLRVRPTQQSIDCGLLTGVTLPPEGPLKEAPVTWDAAQLTRHGTNDCPAWGCQATDNDGLAVLEHTQKIEPGPGGVGPEQEELVTVKASANIARALGPDMAMILQSPLVVRAERQSTVKWHRSYKVKLELESILVVSKAPGYEGKVATARATGTFDVSEARSDGFSREGAVDGFLSVTTQPGPNEGKCNTVTARGGGKIDWQIREAIVWPPEAIAVHMDTGTDTENAQPDKYWAHFCSQGATIVNDKSNGTLWESNIFLGHLYGTLGLAFAGLAPNNGWSVLATDDTWQRGGLVAIWEGDERCGGYCSSGHVQLKLSVTPIPGT